MLFYDNSSRSPLVRSDTDVGREGLTRVFCRVEARSLVWRFLHTKLSLVLMILALRSVALEQEGAIPRADLLPVTQSQSATACLSFT